ncbi:MAG: cobalamin B12-binding domain-containing protein [Promethearchaeota archaeon]
MKDPDLEQALLDVDFLSVQSILHSWVKDNPDIDEILEKIQVIMESIGKKWENSSIALSQVYMAGKLVEQNLNELFEDFSHSIQKNQPESLQKDVYTGVFEDYHALGQIILNSFLRLAGYNVINLGIGLTKGELCEQVKNQQISILLLSTLMLSSAKHLEETIRDLRKIKPNIVIFVGGAPFNFQQDLWERIGADYYGASPNAILPILNNIFKQFNPSNGHSMEVFQ